MRWQGVPSPRRRPGRGGAELGGAGQGGAGTVWPTVQITRHLLVRKIRAEVQHGSLDEPHEILQLLLLAHSVHTEQARVRIAATVRRITDSLRESPGGRSASSKHTCVRTRTRTHAHTISKTRSAAQHAPDAAPFLVHDCHREFGNKNGLSLVAFLSRLHRNLAANASGRAQASCARGVESHDRVSEPGVGDLRAHGRGDVRARDGLAVP